MKIAERGTGSAGVSLAAFRTALARQGWIRFERLVEGDLLFRLRDDLALAQENCDRVRRANGVAQDAEGTVHHLLGQGESFLEFLAAVDLDAHVEAFFGGKFILNSYGGVDNTYGASSYVGRMHRDLRSFSGHVPRMLNVLVMVDDFTAANGATWLLSGSHLADTRPAEDAFFAAAVRGTGRAGDVLVFDSNLWHAAGRNETDAPRRALTLTFTPPFIKPQMDYVRVLGAERVASLPERLQQIIGYLARIPASLCDWYQPPEKRMYRPGQG